MPDLSPIDRLERAAAKVNLGRRSGASKGRVWSKISRGDLLNILDHLLAENLVVRAGGVTLTLSVTASKHGKGLHTISKTFELLGDEP